MGLLDFFDFPQYEFEDLKDVYEAFAQPVMLVEMNGSDISKKGLAVVGAEINISAGFEAGVCTLEIAEVVDRIDSTFLKKKITDAFTLGTRGVISIGYGVNLRNVFFGFVSGIRFRFSEGGIPLCIVTLMDIKGVMMSTRYHQHIEAKDYSGAVKEVFNKTNTQNLMDIYSLNISNTPDHKESVPGSPPGQEEATAYSVEMVDESDYEFVVRAAKRFNFEFFCVADEVIFRKARDGANLLIKVGPEFLITDFDVEYNMTGLVKNIEIRGVNPDKGEVIIGKRKLDYKISNSGKADSLIKDARYILHDATITSKEDAEARLDYLENEISNRFARISIEHIGLPEMVPGRFIKINKLTEKISDRFYITNVTHTFRVEQGFNTRIEGVAPTLSSWS